MPLHWKLVIDTADAPALAEFWAQALGYRVEDNSAHIERLLAAGYVTEEHLAERRGRRHFRGMTAIRHPEDPYDEATGIGHGRRLLFQDVPEPKKVKNRLHLDVHAAPGEREREVARLERLGATVSRTVDQGPAGSWTIMLDPEGNEFCVS
ncbi:VOC family protein [Streptomyces sp. DSM 44917]|uniref:VOC family protein n=1 Tax=Streptomyces boetiae TaxID=3075541 RepID=A0ABU2LC42_9ACTN|nr:VOC family protein [Streptomyces sp. DSM 44917]MDT0309151.1 VOC family protein [Streptomyces sp. DSM 44917]